MFPTSVKMASLVGVMAATVMLACSMSVTASAAEARGDEVAMPSGFPVASDFDGGLINEHAHAFDFERPAGAGGENYGKDSNVPKGRMIVGYRIHERSERHTKGRRDLKLNFDSRNQYRVPVGVHIGHRLTPDKSPTGEGAAYKGTIYTLTVPEADWYRVMKKRS